MDTMTETPSPAQLEPGIDATQAHTHRRARSIAFAAAALVTPIAIGAGVAALARSRRERVLSRSRRAGVLAGGITAAVFAAFRWQLQRFFTDEPAYIVERRIGELEIRRYTARIEAHTRLTVPDFETAIDEGFRRLAQYIFGDNDRHEKIAMTTPVLTTPRATTHSVAFVMPPDRTLLSLPRPADDRIKLVHVPARRIAALRFHGRYTDKMMLEQTRRLHELVAANELETKGQPMFAGFDPPSTLPLLRRTEMWIELA
jgi:hypothetical protein